MYNISIAAREFSYKQFVKNNNKLLPRPRNGERIDHFYRDAPHLENPKVYLGVDGAAVVRVGGAVVSVGRDLGSRRRGWRPVVVPVHLEKA